MKLEVQAPEGTGTELYRWLMDDPDVAGSTDISAADSGASEMGIGFDILSVVLPNAIALGQLVAAIVTYRASRQQSTGSAPSITINHANMIVLVEGDGSGAVGMLTQNPKDS